MTPEQEWIDEPNDPVRCDCHCHGVVRFNDAGMLVAAYRSPPRYDNDQGWAESCTKCEIAHWTAAQVHDHVVSMEADYIDDAHCRVLNLKRNK